MILYIFFIFISIAIHAMENNSNFKSEYYNGNIQCYINKTKEIDSTNKIDPSVKLAWEELCTSHIGEEARTAKQEELNSTFENIKKTLGKYTINFLNEQKEKYTKGQYPYREFIILLNRNIKEYQLSN